MGGQFQTKHAKENTDELPLHFHEVVHASYENVELKGINDCHNCLKWELTEEYHRAPITIDRVLYLF